MEKEKGLLDEAAYCIVKTMIGYCQFMQTYMKQQAERPGGITVSPGDFQDGFRALNHASVAVERICRVLEKAEPDN